MLASKTALKKKWKGGWKRVCFLKLCGVESLMRVLDFFQAGVGLGGGEGFDGSADSGAGGLGTCASGILRGRAELCQCANDSVGHWG